MTQTASPPAATIHAHVHHSALKRVTKFWASRPIEIFIETPAELAPRRRHPSPRQRRDTHQTRRPRARAVRTAPCGDRHRRRRRHRRPGRPAELRRERLDRRPRLPRGRRRHGDTEPGAPRLPDILAPHARRTAKPGRAGRWSLRRNTSRAGATPWSGATTQRLIHPAAAVRFEAAESADMIRAALASAARHYPLPVTFEGEALERKAFLDGNRPCRSMERTRLRRLPGPATVATLSPTSTSSG